MEHYKEVGLREGSWSVLSVWAKVSKRGQKVLARPELLSEKKAGGCARVLSANLLHGRLTGRMVGGTSSCQRSLLWAIFPLLIGEIYNASYGVSG